MHRWFGQVLVQTLPHPDLRLVHGHDHDIDPVHLIIAWLGTALPRNRAFSEPRVSGTYTLGRGQDTSLYTTSGIFHASFFGR